MSLINEQTGKPATPLAELSNRSEEMKRMTENQLLKEALAISSENCKSLIERQNALIEELRQEVKRVRQDNESLTKSLQWSTEYENKQMREIVKEERQFKAEIGKTTRETVIQTASEMAANVREQTGKALQDVRTELKETAKEIGKEREEMQLEHGFRKFMFWATPFLLLAQTVLTIIALLK